MIYRGKVRGDTVMLPPGVWLPDGTEVNIEPIMPREATPTPSRAQVVRNGVPLLPRTNGFAPDLELVNKLRDAEP
ncbi:MAG: hypothetical protein L0211_04710 [Planctomycetaceae bacterium]|nr:hypothetical protein [Planctomycetaceae bacterium]